VGFLLLLEHELKLATRALSRMVKFLHSLLNKRFGRHLRFSSEVARCQHLPPATTAGCLCAAA